MGKPVTDRLKTELKETEKLGLQNYKDGVS